MIAAHLLWASLAAVGAKPAAKASRPDVPVQVRCDDMVIENRHSVAHCEGNVVAVRQNVTVNCDHAVAQYDEAARVTELTCLGRVHVVQRPAPRAAGAPPGPIAPKTADGDKGVYLESDRTLTLTGHATLQQGEDRLIGEPIVFYVDEDRVKARAARLAGQVQDAIKKDAEPARHPPAQDQGKPQ